MGMRISSTPSTTTKTGVRMLAFLYSRRDLPSVRMMCPFGRFVTAADALFVALTLLPFLLVLLRYVVQ